MKREPKEFRFVRTGTRPAAHRSRRPDYVVAFVNLCSLVLVVAIIAAVLVMKRRCERHGGHFLLGFPFYECVVSR